MMKVHSFAFTDVKAANGGDSNDRNNPKHHGHS